METLKFMKKNRLQEGEMIRLMDGRREYIGSVLPPSPQDNGVLRLKLKSGYNIGARISAKTTIEKLGQAQKVGKGTRRRTEQDNELPKIAILHIGGTIASRVDYRTGAVTAGFEPED